MSRNKQENKQDSQRERPVRTPPDYLKEPRVCSKEYVEAMKPFKLVLETDGFGVIVHQ
jgi:hypothetical protein